MELLSRCYEDEEEHCSKCLDEDHDDHIESEICCLCWEKANRGRDEFDLAKIENVYDVDMEDSGLVVWNLVNGLSQHQFESMKDFLVEKLEEAGLETDNHIIISGLNNVEEIERRE